MLPSLAGSLVNAHLLIGAWFLSGGMLREGSGNTQAFIADIFAMSFGSAG